MKTEQRFGLKMRNFEFLKMSSNIQAPGRGLLGENNKTTSSVLDLRKIIN